MNFPSFVKINSAAGIDTFASHYAQCSGFNVNRDYYESSRVFGVYIGSRMIGGFVLADGSTLRTLEVFAGGEHRAELYQKVQQHGTHTEMCCFWIAPDCRKKTWINFFVWICVAYALHAYGAKQLIFGTNSARLATLYSHASKSRLLHTDYLNHRQTFIFHGPRKYCLLGVAEILSYKAKRLIKISSRRSERVAPQWRFNSLTTPEGLQALPELPPLFHFSNSTSMKNTFSAAILSVCVATLCFFGCQTKAPKNASMPELPASLKTDPASQFAFSLKAVGYQVYECRKDTTDPAGKSKWFLKEPIADLFDEKGQLVGTHGKGPHWKSTVSGDDSKVTGILPGGKPKGRADSPSTGAIPWLLVDAKGEGQGRFANITQIQRIDTNGGKAPEACCDGSGCCTEVRMPYTATYYFYESLQK